jgi:hypothetical protein
VKSFLIALLLLLCSVFVAAESLVEQIVMQKYEPNWTGLIMVCDPYCEFLSSKEGDRFFPSVKGKSIDPDSLKFVANSDPLYPLLVLTFPIKPFVDEGIIKNIKNAKDQVSPNPSIPEYVNLSFDWGFKAKGGVLLENYKFETNNQLQADLTSLADSSNVGALVELMVIKGKAISFLGSYFRPEATLLVQEQRLATQNTAVGLSTNQMGFKIWAIKEHYHWGVGLFNEELKITPSLSDSLRLFSNQENNLLLSMGLRTLKNLSFQIDYLIRSSLFDGQNYRAEPVSHQRYDFGAQYCVPNLQIFNLRFGLCGEAKVSQATQQAAINPIYSTDLNSQFTRTIMRAGFFVQIGEDLFL